MTETYKVTVFAQTRDDIRSKLLDEGEKYFGHRNIEILDLRVQKANEYMLEATADLIETSVL